MKRLAVSVFVTGLVIGQSFNGPVTEAVGLYLIALAAIYLVIAAISSVAGAMGEQPYVPSKEYAEDFAARMSGTEKPGSSRPCPFQHGEDASPGEGPGDIVSSLGTGPTRTRSRPTPAPPARRSAAETDRPYTYTARP